MQTATVFLVFLGAGLIPDHSQILMWVLQALLCFFGFYINVATYRAYFCSVEGMRQVLKSFKLADAYSYCCSSDHRGKGGVPLLCDRSVIHKCISEWFGSLEHFEQLVQTEVLDSLAQQLSSEFFSYRQCLVSMVPVIWSFMDTASAELHFEVNKQTGLLKAVRELARGLGWWLGVAPSALLVGARLSYVMRRRCHKPCDALLNLPPLLSIVAVVMGMSQIEFLCFGLFRVKSEFAANMAVFAGVAVLLAAVLFVCVGVHPRYVPGPRAESGATL